MSANVKYTPAPQEDPELLYTQPPPSYQAEFSSSAQDHQRLYGGPRSSEDNIPDDFKVSAPSRCCCPLSLFFLSALLTPDPAVRRLHR